jgi:hypothetical protein
VTSPNPGFYQNELRDLRGNAMVGAVVDVFEVGTTTPATLYSDSERTPMAASPLPVAAGLNRPGIDVAANIAFYAEDLDEADEPLEYDVRVAHAGNVFTFRAKPAPASGVGDGYVPIDGDTPTDVLGIVRFRGPDDENPIVAKPASDTRAGAFDLQTQSGTGFLFHLTGVEGTILGIGPGADAAVGGLGMVMNIRGEAKGEIVTAFASCSTFGAADSYPITWQQNATNAPFLHASQGVAGAKPLIELVADVNEPGQKLLRWAGAGWGGDNEGGYIDADTGAVNIRRGGIRAFNGTGIFASDGDVGSTTAGRAQLDMVANEGRLRTYRYSGAGSLFYAGGLRSAVDKLVIEVATGAAAIGAEAMATKMTFDANVTVDAGAWLLVGGPLGHSGSHVGFYGTAPVTKPTGVAVTAAGVHAALVTLGLIAA